MEKIKQYTAAIINLLETHQRPTANAADETVHSELIIDSNRHHYMLVNIGFTPKNGFDDSIIIHFRIKENNKIWLLANWTETDVAEELIKRGVEKNDIILGFFPQHLRAYTEYAVQ